MDLVIALLIGYVAGVISVVEWALCAANKREKERSKTNDDA